MRRERGEERALPLIHKYIPRASQCLHISAAMNGPSCCFYNIQQNTKACMSTHVSTINCFMTSRSCPKGISLFFFPGPSCRLGDSRPSHFIKYPVVFFPPARSIQYIWFRWSSCTGCSVVLGIDDKMEAGLYCHLVTKEEWILSCIIHKKKKKWIILEESKSFSHSLVVFVLRL